MTDTQPNPAEFQPGNPDVNEGRTMTWTELDQKAVDASAVWAAERGGWQGVKADYAFRDGWKAGHADALLDAAAANEELRAQRDAAKASDAQTADDQLVSDRSNPEDA